MSRTGTSVYPGTADSFARVGTANYEDEVGYEHTNLHNEAMSAIEKIETVLGTTSGTSILKYVSAGEFLVTDTGMETLSNKLLTAPLLQGNVSGWVYDTDTWVYVSASSFKIEGKDVTARFPKGTKILLNQTTDKYFYVTSASFSTDTTVNVTGGTAWEYSLSNAAIDLPKYSYMAYVQGFPEEGLNYTPTISVTANAGTFTAVKVQINNNQIVYKGRISYGTTLASGNLTLSLPINTLYSLLPIGFAHYFDSGVADQRCFVNPASGSTIDFYLTGGTSSFTGPFVDSSAWSASDVLDWECKYTWIS